MPITTFETQRLKIRDWTAALADPARRSALELALRSILSPAVLAPLPPPLQLTEGPGDLAAWVDARAAESDVLSITEKATSQLVGLVILAQIPEPADQTTVHIGYLFAEVAWGQGLASEMLQGLVFATRADAPLKLLGGVDVSNPASARVLQKAGFHQDPGLSDEQTHMFALDVL